MMAPRPMLMIAATGDWTKNTPREEFPAVRSIYQLYGKADNVEMVQIDAPHNYNKPSREAMYAFFARRVLGQDVKEVKERNAHVEKLQDLLVWQNRAMPPGALTYDQVVEQWVAESKKQAEGTRDSALLRERLRLALGAEWPEKVVSQVDGEHIVLSRAGKGDRVSGLKVGTGVPSVLVIHPDGAEAARKSAPETKESTLFLTVFQTGEAVAPRDRSVKHFLAFNRTDDANRVQDILTALAYLKQQGANEVRVVGTGNASIWAVFAAAVSPVPVKLDGGLEGFTGEDKDYIDRFFVPGIQRAGGLGAALRCVK